MRRIIAFLLVSVMLTACLVSCSDKKKDIDLSKYIVAKSEHYEIDGAMYAYFLYDIVAQNETYLPMYGYDTSLSLREQTAACPLEENSTWFDFFRKMADNYINYYLAAAEAAYNEGVTLSEEDKEDIDDYIEEMNTSAVKNGYKNLEALLAEYYVKGIKEDSFKECLTLQQLAYVYMNGYSKKLEVTDADMIKFRDDNPDYFQMIDVIQYGFYAEYGEDATADEKKLAYADAKKRAEDFLKNNKGIEAFKNGIVAIENEGKDEPDDAAAVIAKFTLDAEYYSSEAAKDEATKPYYDWAYSADRKAGDTYILEEKFYDGEPYYTVSCILTPVYISDYLTKDCRHILFYVDTEETDEEKLAAAKADALAKANAVLAEFNGGDKSEESFKALEKKHLDDASAMEATAYYDVTLGYMVKEFESWIYGERKTGDCEVVETEYGFHVVYFIGDGREAWKLDAEAGIIDGIMTKYQDELVEEYKVTYDEEAMKKIP